MSSDGVREVFEIPVAEGSAISYPAALTTQGTNPDAAARLLAFLQGPDARVVFEQAGFIVPEPQP
jgi:molybdate transport system substrate-binding protein